ncbi:MAG TPA: acyltransferase family protein, partial [Burkholderiaceae bacterium]
LLSRITQPAKVKHAFLLSSVMIVAALALPRFGGEHDLWKNGLYECLCIIFVFPLVVYLGACGDLKNSLSDKVCGFLGSISYPLYIIHYPFVYTYFAWVANRQMALSDALPVAVATYSVCVALAYLFLRFYDIPIRNWLGKRHMGKEPTATQSAAVIK